MVVRALAGAARPHDQMTTQNHLADDVISIKGQEIKKPFRLLSVP
jgi:hypothetical protein